jgi:hypothetical protein
MKKIIAIILALISLSAFAEKEFRYTSNQSGGYIYLTYENCVYKNTGQIAQKLFYFYSTNSGGGIVQGGCYSYENGFYRATYDDGAKYIWNANNFYKIGQF